MVADVHRPVAGKYMRTIFAGFILLSLMAGLWTPVSVGHAQASQGWSAPINLSNSGSSTTPSLVVDSNGVIHVIWVDQIDGYKLAESGDGVQWTTPKKVRFPFSPENDSQPVFLADNNGAIHVFWQDRRNTLFYSQAASATFGDPSKWTGNTKLADSVINFNAVIDARGIVYIGYVASQGDDINPAGVYFSKRKGSSWSEPRNIYLSQYFRLLTPENSNVRIAVSNGADFVGHIFVVWDDRTQKRIYMAKSSDDGVTWDDSVQLKGPEESSGLDQPYNINVGVVDGALLLMWQMGIPGGRCVLNSQFSLDEGKNFNQPVKLLEKSFACPQRSEFVLEKKDLSVVSLQMQDDLSLIAWNGSGWSELQTQSEISTFLNPSTFDSVLLGCQKISYHNDLLLIVGCDQGGGGDIWFSSRALGSVADWFPSPSAWSPPVEVTSTNLDISSLRTVVDDKNVTHVVWVQSSNTGGDGDTTTIESSQWEGGNWSNPAAIFSGLDGKPLQLTANADRQGRLFLAWIDGRTGEILFSWASAERANRASEWEQPQYVPSNSQSVSAPVILVDGSGKIIVGYAVPINEQRGIYFVESDDAGRTWTQPVKIFDALAAGWDMVDQPRLSLTGDGRLHVLFNRYSLQANQRQSQGLFYSQSANGGITWSKPEMVSDQPILWSDIIGYDQSTLHRLWQENEPSSYINFHQVSQDGGITWSKPTIISRVSGTFSLVDLVVDPAGGLHLLQLVNADQLSIRDQQWDGARWKKLEDKEVDLVGKGIPSSMAAGITYKGNIIASVSINSPDSNRGAKNDIVTLSRVVQLPAEIPLSQPATMSTPAPVTALAGQTPNAVQSPTQESPLANLSDAPPLVSKNIMGIILVGGLSALIIVLIWPRSRAPKK